MRESRTRLPIHGRWPRASSSPTPAITVRVAARHVAKVIDAYVVLAASHDEPSKDVIWGVGDTPEAAWLDAIKCMKGNSDLVQITARCVPATADVLKAVDEEDGFVRDGWRLMEVCCTYNEYLSWIWGLGDSSGDAASDAGAKP